MMIANNSEADRQLVTHVNSNRECQDHRLCQNLLNMLQPTTDLGEPTTFFENRRLREAHVI
jgi:hypothetical protein